MENSHEQGGEAVLKAQESDRKKAPEREPLEDSSRRARGEREPSELSTRKEKTFKRARRV